MRQMFRWKSIWLRWCNLTINNIGKDLHKSDKCVLWTLRQGDRFSWISNLVSLSILVSHSSLSKHLESQPTLIQAVTVIIYTWKIWKRWRKRKLRGANYISSNQGHLVWYEIKIVIPYYELQAGGGVLFGGKIEVWGSSNSAVVFVPLNLILTLFHTENYI